MPVAGKQQNKVAIVVLGSILGVLALCLVVGVVGAALGIGDKPSDTETTASEVLEYTVASQDGGKIVVEVDRVLTQAEMTAIAEDLQGNQSEDAGYFVSVNCSTGGTAKVDNRLGNIRFGIGAKGKAATGLDEGLLDVQVNEGRTCPA